MKCKKCGTEFSKGSFCPECGTKIQDDKENRIGEQKLVQKANSENEKDKGKINVSKANTVNENQYTDTGNKANGGINFAQKKILIPLCITAAIIVVIILSFVFLFVIGLIGSNTNGTNSESKSDTAVYKNDNRSYTPYSLYSMASKSDNMPYIISSEATRFLRYHDDLFPAVSYYTIDDYIDFDADYRDVSKNPEKYGDELIIIPNADVMSIYETEIDTDEYVTEMSVTSYDYNYSFYCIYYGKLSDIHNGDTVKIYGLPLGESTYDNVAGGRNSTVVIAGSYVEKLNTEGTYDYEYFNSNETETYAEQGLNGYNLNLGDIFETIDWASSWKLDDLHNDYYLIPIVEYNSDTIIYFTSENNLDDDSKLYNLIPDSIETTENGELRVEGSMYVGDALSEFNGFFSVTWDINHAKVELISGHRSTETSMTGEYLYYDGIENDATSLGEQAEYILPESDSKYLTYDDVKWMNSIQLRLAINEIYARHGRKFQSDDLSEYFMSKSWYKPRYSQEEFSAIEDQVFNEYEKANIVFLGSIRDAMN